MSDENSHGMSIDEKRIVFAVIASLIIFVIFMSGLTAWVEQSWEPIVQTAIILGFVIGFVAFFVTAFALIWSAAKHIFPKS